MLNRTAMARELGVSVRLLRTHDVPNPAPVSLLVHMLFEPPDWLREAWSSCVRVARSSRSPRTLDRLSAHPYPSVRLFVAANETTAPDALRRLSTDHSVSVRRNLLANPSVPVDALDVLVSDGQVIDGYEMYLANNPSAPIALREGIKLYEFDRPALAAMVNTVLTSPLFDEKSGDPLPGVVGPGELLLDHIMEDEGGRWSDSPARDLLCASPHIVQFTDATIEVFCGLAEETTCSLPELVIAVQVVLR